MTVTAASLPVFPVERAVRIVLLILAGEVGVAEVASSVKVFPSSRSGTGGSSSSRRARPVLRRARPSWMARSPTWLKLRADRRPLTHLPPSLDPR